MTKIIPLRSFAIFLAVLFLAACSKNNSGPAELTLETNAVTVAPDQYKEVAILTGNGGYTATSARPELAYATVRDGKVIIEGVDFDGGTTTITVKDTENKTATINVTVTHIPADILAVSETEVSLVLGTEDNEVEIEIVSGNGSYSLTPVGDALDYVEVDDSGLNPGPDPVIRFTGLAVGTAEFELSDSRGQTVTITVKVVNPLTVDNTELTLVLNTVNSNGIFYIQNGNGLPAIREYSVSPVGDAADIAAIMYFTYDDVTSNVAYLHFKAVSPGTAKYILTDPSGQEVELTVTVEYAPLLLDQYDERTVTAGTYIRINIISGNGQYDAVIKGPFDTRILDVYKTGSETYVAFYQTITGKFTLTITDTISGQTAEVKITTV